MTSVTGHAIKPLLVRVQYGGYYIEAVPFFSLTEPGWKAKAFVWRHTGEPVEQFGSDSTGATFSTREHAVHASPFLGRNWADEQA